MGELARKPRVRGRIKKGPTTGRRAKTQFCRNHERDRATPRGKDNIEQNMESVFFAAEDTSVDRILLHHHTLAMSDFRLGTVD
jgi:hypothetical protein